MITIARAQPCDAEILTKTARAAKAHWGYPQEWILRWRDELTISPTYIATHPVFVAAVDGHIAGFFAIRRDEKIALLDHLWVLPSFIGQGLGHRLFQEAENLARESGAAALKIVSDPHAEGFYTHMEAVTYAHQPASMDGKERSLPLMEKSLR